LRTAPAALVVAALLLRVPPASTRGAASPGPVLSKVIDLPLPGQPSRFDYQRLDPEAKRLYFSHMGDGELLVLNTETRELVAHLPGFPRTTGVLVVPGLRKVFVSVPGNHEIAVVDTLTLKVLARIPDGEFPDGLAYAPDVQRVFVSDERGGKETVIDARANQRVGTIDLGGEIGNTQYDPASHLVFANVQTRGEMVAIDPKTERVVARHPLAVLRDMREPGRLSPRLAPRAYGHHHRHARRSRPLPAGRRDLARAEDRLGNAPPRFAQAPAEQPQRVRAQPFRGTASTELARHNTAARISDGGAC
jgi:DNA-binding beta-propeller fold protein YncE